MDFEFFFRSILLGIGLAMDAFSVSLANGMNEPKMKPLKMCGTAGIFAFFQFLMPMIGWLCVTLIASVFGVFEKFIPWIALFLLCFIGGKMIFDAVRHKEDDAPTKSGLGALVVQGIATSIDALSVGFTIAEYKPYESIIACLIIGVLTFGICLGGVFIGKRVGDKLSNKAGIFGGVILIIIGLEIFITSWF